MRNNLKLGIVGTLIILMNTGCKKEPEPSFKAPNRTIDLLHGRHEAKPKKLFKWEPPQAESARQKLRGKQYTIFVSKETSDKVRQVDFEKTPEADMQTEFNKHARYFLINEPWSTKAKRKFVEALRKHIQSPMNDVVMSVSGSNETISHMINIYDHRTGINVELDYRYHTSRIIFRRVIQIGYTQADQLAISGKWPSDMY